jgi:hypothetical protein
MRVEHNEAEPTVETTLSSTRIEITMKKTKKLSLNRETLRALTLSSMHGVVGGISGAKGCNFSDNGCDPTFNTCPISGEANCHTGGSCNSLACSQGCATTAC